MEPTPGEIVDEAEDLDLGVIDFVLGALTLPLLFWAALYAVSGHERLYATRAARVRVYLWLLVIEAALVGALVWWITR